MQDSSLDHLLVGVFLTLVGFAIIFLHRSIKKQHDWWKSRDWPIGLGRAWTGKYTRGGLIFAYALIILVGLAFVGVGISQIVRVFRP